MVTVQNIYDFLNQKAPFALQEDWDNSGLLAGDPAAPVERILLALDMTDDVIEEAKDCKVNLIVSHHPVIFRPIRRATLCEGDLSGRKVWSLARYNIAAICAHTNLDAVEGGVNTVLAGALGLTDLTILEPSGTAPDGQACGIGRIGTLTQPESVEEFLHRVQNALHPAALRYVSGGKQIQKAAVGGGACGEMLTAAVQAGCDAFVTSDLKYNAFLDAKELGLTLIDAGHYPTENPVMETVGEWLKEAFPKVEVLRSAKHSEVISSFS